MNHVLVAALVLCLLTPGCVEEPDSGTTTSTLSTSTTSKYTTTTTIESMEIAITKADEYYEKAILCYLDNYLWENATKYGINAFKIYKRYNHSEGIYMTRELIKRIDRDCTCIGGYAGDLRREAGYAYEKKEYQKAKEKYQTARDIYNITGRLDNASECQHYLDLIRVSDTSTTVTTTVTTTTQFHEDARYTEARKDMVVKQLKGRGIHDKRVLDAMGKVPRHEFVDRNMKNTAYADHPLPIGHGQTISQPYIVALMTQALELNGSEKVLEIGTGSGYQAAVLSRLCNETYSIEIIDELAREANETLHRLNHKARVKSGDGYFGWEENAPYDAIIITCAANHIPPPLIEQLRDGGRLVIPLGSVRYHQTLTLVRKKGGNIETEYITGVRFVPMTGEAMKNS